MAELTNQNLHINNFENVLLKNLITDKQYFGKVSTIIQPKYFKQPGNQIILKLIKDYYNDYGSTPGLIELITKAQGVPGAEVRKAVAEELKIISTLELPKDPKFIIDSTIKFVRDAMFLEAVILGSDSITSQNVDDQIKAWEIMESAFRVNIDTDLGLDYDDIESRIDYYQTALHGMLPDGFIELNKRLGPGFLPGTLSIVLSQSGGGKSLLMTALISSFVKQGKNVLLVSMEMSANEIVKRVDANILEIPINTLSNTVTTELSHDFDTKTMKEKIREKFEQAKSKGLGKFFTKAYAPGTFSANNLEALLDSFSTEKDIEFDIVFLDYLGIMKSDRLAFSVGPYNYVKSIAEETRAVAVRRDIPIISAQQLNRSAVGNLDADNSAVADSLGTVQTADFLCFMLQTEELKTQKIINFKITKNRFNGRTDFFTMNIDYELMKFLDVPQNQNQDENKVTESIMNAEIQRINLEAAEANKKALDNWDKPSDSIEDLLKDFV